MCSSHISASAILTRWCIQKRVEKIVSVKARKLRSHCLSHKPSLGFFALYFLCFVGENIGQPEGDKGTIMVKASSPSRWVEFQPVV